MKKYILLIASLIIATTALPKKRILFMGDSITDGGWGNSGGSMMASSERNHTDMNHIYGHSYMMLCASQLESEFPGDFEFFNRGISGDDIWRMAKRWKEDVLDLQPDVLSLLVGTNDVHYYLDNQIGKGNSTDTFNIDAWEKEYRNLLTECRLQNPKIKIILGKPFTAKVGYVGKRADYDIRKNILSEMAKRIDNIGEDFSAVVLDYPILFDSLQKEHTQVETSYWIWDGIHPTPAGHRRMADLWLKTFASINE